MRLAVALVVAACSSDPSLHVVVTHPSGAAVATTTITVYESDSLTCDDVALSRLTADQLAAVAVTSETIDGNDHVTGALEGISRTDHKVVVAYGFDAMTKPIAAGCAEVGVVDGPTELPIATEVAVTVSLLPPDPTSNDPLAVAIAATDPDGRAVADRPVSWTVYGPAGSLPLRPGGVTTASDGVWEPAAPTCTGTGLVKLHPVPPAVVGGYAVQMRVAWATQQPALYTSLSSANLSLMTFKPPAGSTRYCAVRISGATHRLDCLDGSSSGVIARDYELQVSGGAVMLVERQNQVVNAEAIAIVSVPDGDDRDAYAVTTRGRLVELFGAPAADNSNQLCAPAMLTCPTPVDDAIVLPPCGPLPAKILMHTSAAAAGQLEQMDARGSAPQPYPLPPSTLADPIAQLDRAGCVTTIDPGGGAPALRQVTSIHMGRNLLGSYNIASTHVSYDCSATSCSTIATVPGAGVGFTAGSEPRMVMTSVDATGVVVLQVVMVADATGKDHFIERSRAPAAALPEHVVVGEYDTDSTADVLFDIATKRGSLFEIAYARMIGDQPLEALSAQQLISVSDVLSADLTGDGLDDLVITGGDALITGIAAVAMDVPVTTTVPTADPVCMP